MTPSCYEIQSTPDYLSLSGFSTAFNRSRISQLTRLLQNLGLPSANATMNRKEMFYLTTHSTHFIYSYMASDIWLRTILIVRKETCCCHIGYSYRLTARVLLYAPSHRQDSTLPRPLLHQSWSTGWSKK